MYQGRNHGFNDCSGSHFNAYEPYFSWQGNIGSTGGVGGGSSTFAFTTNDADQTTPQYSYFLTEYMLVSMASDNITPCMITRRCRVVHCQDEAAMLCIIAQCYPQLMAINPKTRWSTQNTMASPTYSTTDIGRQALQGVICTGSRIDPQGRYLTNLHTLERTSCTPPVGHAKDGKQTINDERGWRPRDGKLHVTSRRGPCTAHK
jgi:hypothetical protein